MATLPTPANHCQGTYASGEANHQFRCVKSYDDEGLPVYACTTRRLYNAQCLNGINRQCSSNSRAFVASITICIQRLFV